MSVADGLGSRKLKVLADTAVTLARFHPNIVAADIIKRMLKVGRFNGTCTVNCGHVTSFGCGFQVEQASFPAHNLYLIIVNFHTCSPQCHRPTVA